MPGYTMGSSVSLARKRVTAVPSSLRSCPGLVGSTSTIVITQSPPADVSELTSGDQKEFHKPPTCLATLGGSSTTPMKFFFSPDFSFASGVYVIPCQSVRVHQGVLRCPLTSRCTGSPNTLALC